MLDLLSSTIIEKFSFESTAPCEGSGGQDFIRSTVVESISFDDHPRATHAQSLMAAVTERC